MIETVRLFDEDAYVTEFDGMVIACEPIEKEGKQVYQVVLDQTMFFPEEGGQTPDQGTIQNIPVLDVQIKKGIIYHTLGEPLECNTKVHGVINWNYRFSNMQQHSGEHIFSGIVHEKYGFDNVGFHLSDQVVTMDFNGVLSPEDADSVEQAVNEVIALNLPVEVTYPTKKELEFMEYRSKIEIEGQVRIVTIPGVDVCACCAPHVKHTGEIGMLKILSMQSYKGGVRISILCGFRALQDYRQKTNLITELSTILSANQDNIVESVVRFKNLSQSLRSELIQLKKEFLEAKITNIPVEQENVILFEKDIEAPVMRSVINELVKKHTGICGIFTAKDCEGYQFIIGSAHQDTRVVMTRLKEKFSARGGGSEVMVQGSVMATREAIEACLEV
ncbi:alanyl-tRNA editing protein [Anaerosporobacter faecicola]|uniref:alanyl-tRNA editing protein n=1 Tax=Anaerosporobacter faecicola TaxID=2718714 RepID=UPI00143C7C65|nr:alanyl-tRNA editing protein [Anaerosporobacter faecicola]